MINITVPAFQGMAPRVSPALLEPTQGVSVTGSMTSGELRPWRVPEFVEACGADTWGIYLTPEGDWLTWDEPVQVVPGVQANDAFGRLYYTRESGGLFVISSMDDYTEFRAGVPKPAEPPTVAITGTGSGTVEDRVYIYSYVNDWGEEGAPSDPSEFHDWQTGQTVKLSGFTPPPLGFKEVVAIRVYRMAVGDKGADWFFVAEFPAEDAAEEGYEFTDNVAELALGEAISTQDYDIPQLDARGLVSVGNGVLATFEGNEIAFSEPYLPYAWPDKFRQNVPGSVIALGQSASSCVVLTNRNPHYIFLSHGSSAKLDPEEYGLYPLGEQTPCVSPYGVVSTEFGVIFPAPDGLRVLDGSGPSKLVTDKLVTAKEWTALFDPLNALAAYHDGHYFGFVPGGGFALHIRTGVLTWTGVTASAVHSDGLSLFLAVNDAIMEWEAGVGLLLGIFKSKVFRYPKPVNMSFVRVDSAYDDFFARLDRILEDIRTANASMGRNVLSLATESWMDHSVAGDNLNDLPYTGFDLAQVHLRVWGDGKLRYDRQLPVSGAERLPMGYLAREWQFEILTPVHVKQVSIGTSVRAMMGAGSVSAGGSNR